MNIDLGGNTLVNGYFGGLLSGPDADVLLASDIGVTVQGWSFLLDSIVAAGEAGNILYPDGTTILASDASSPQALNYPNGYILADSDGILYWGDGGGHPLADNSDNLWLRGGLYDMSASLGTSGQVLTSDGTNATWQPPSGGESYPVDFEGSTTIFTAASNPIFVVDENDNPLMTSTMNTGAIGFDSSGNVNFFGAAGSTTPFTMDAGAPDNSLVVNSDGSVNISESVLTTDISNETVNVNGNNSLTGNIAFRVSGGRMAISDTISDSISDYCLLGYDSYLQNMFLDANIVGASIGFFTNNGSSDSLKMEIDQNGVITTVSGNILDDGAGNITAQSLSVVSVSSFDNGAAFTDGTGVLTVNGLNSGTDWGQVFDNEGNGTFNAITVNSITSDGGVFSLPYTGSGYLASGGLSWDSYGNLTVGSGGAGYIYGQLDNATVGGSNLDILLSGADSAPSGTSGTLLMTDGDVSNTSTTTTRLRYSNLDGFLDGLVSGDQTVGYASYSDTAGTTTNATNATNDQYGNRIDTTYLSIYGLASGVQTALSTPLGTTSGLVVTDGSGSGVAYFQGDGSVGSTPTGVFLPIQAPTVSAPTYVLGGMYFDTTLNKLRIGGATGWETVTSV